MGDSVSRGSRWGMANISVVREIRDEDFAVNRCCFEIWGQNEVFMTLLIMLGDARVSSL